MVRTRLRACLSLTVAVLLLIAAGSAPATAEKGPPAKDVTVRDEAGVLAILPSGGLPTALIFICGSGTRPEAYATLLRPVAQTGNPVFIVPLAQPVAPLHAQRPVVFERVRRVMAAHPEITNWVLGGHSLGAALSVLFAESDARSLAGLLLIATNYPTTADLSGLAIPVTQIYATHDGITSPAKALAASRRLPPHTRRIEIEGGNHAQFGRYGEQAFDGKATIPRERQEAMTRVEIMRLLAEVDQRGEQK